MAEPSEGPLWTHLKPLGREVRAWQHGAARDVMDNGCLIHIYICICITPSMDPYMKDMFRFVQSTLKPL